MSTTIPKTFWDATSWDLFWSKRQLLQFKRSGQMLVRVGQLLKRSILLYIYIVHYIYTPLYIYILILHYILYTRIPLRSLEQLLVVWSLVKSLGQAEKLVHRLVLAAFAHFASAWNWCCRDGDCPCWLTAPNLCAPTVGSRVASRDDCEAMTATSEVLDDAEREQKSRNSISDPRFYDGDKMRQWVKGRNLESKHCRCLDSIL